MSKLIISNNIDKFSKSVELLKDSGLNQLITKLVDNTHISTFAKRKYSLGNFYSNGESDFVAVSGTLMYKGFKAVKALESLLQDFDGDVCNAKKTCIGLYSVAIYKNSVLYVFNDYYGLYDLNYVFNDKDFFICNSLSNTAQVNKTNKIDEFELIRTCFLDYCFTYKTPFKKVFKLKGREYFIIKNNCISKESIDYDSYKFNALFISESDSSSKLEQLLIKYSKQISTNFDNISLNCTGGLDSRIVLATLLNSSSTIQLLYGKGNSILAPTCDEDFNIVKTLAKKFSLPLYEMNWKDPELEGACDFNFQKELFRKYGFSNYIYSGNKNIMDEYSEKIPNYPAFMEFGYFLESLRLREWAENLHNEFFSLDDFVDSYYLGNLSNNIDYKNFSEFRNSVKEEFLDIIKEQNIKIVKGIISVNDFERLRWNIARYADSRMAVFINEFTCSFPIFSIPEIHELILSLPANIIKEGKFQIKMINKINKEMTKLPLFSHRRLFKINSNNTKSKIYNFKNIADFFFKNFIFLKTPLVFIYRKLYYKNYSFMSDKILDEIKSITLIQPLKTLNLNKCSRYSLYGYRQFMIGYSSLFVKKNSSKI